MFILYDLAQVGIVQELEREIPLPDLLKGGAVEHHVGQVLLLPATHLAQIRLDLLHLHHQHIGLVDPKQHPVVDGCFLDLLTVQPGHGPDPGRLLDGEVLNVQVGEGGLHLGLLLLILCPDSGPAICQLARGSPYR